MTETQKNQIVEMRKNGIGYRTIGYSIGLSRDVVRNFCISRGMTGVGNRDYITRENLGKKCKYCLADLGQPITGRKRIFCSDRCRRAWWRAHPEKIQKKDSALYTLVCQKCGKEYLSYGNKERKYCSQECYIQARFWDN